jgi:hypothetical protein
MVEDRARQGQAAERVICRVIGDPSSGLLARKAEARATNS